MTTSRENDGGETQQQARERRRGARVRTHLANERTFLAWVRTGLTFMALGMAAAQLLNRETLLGMPMNKLLASVMIVFGAALVAVGRWRYRSTARGIITDTYRPAARGLEIAVAALVVVSVLALVFVIRLD